jgi:putative aldouronate transport system permease protein
VYPFLYTLSMSFSSVDAVNRNAVWLFPVEPTLDGYGIVLKNQLLFTSFGNSLFYTVVGTALNLAATCLAAYPLSRRKFILRKPLNFFLAFTMYFSGGLIPTYVFLTSLGFYNSRWVMILPCLLSTYNVMVLRSAFSELSGELIESAQIDGANDWVILFKLAIPLVKPTLAVLALYYAVGHWNDFFTAMIYLGKTELQPLQLLLRRVLLEASNEMLSTNMDVRTLNLAATTIQVRYVTIVVATVPILAVYPFLQKYFVKGIMVGAVKG